MPDILSLFRPRPEAQSRRLRLQADRIEASVEKARAREALPGGLFGTYWRHGIVGRDEARGAAIRRWHAEMDKAAELRTRAATGWIEATPMPADMPEQQPLDPPLTAEERRAVEAMRDASAIVGDGARPMPYDLVGLVRRTRDLAIRDVAAALERRYTELQTEYGPPNPSVEPAHEFVRRTFGGDRA